MTESSKFMVVLSTVPSPEVGKDIARDLVQRRLAACVNVIPGLVSIYEWEGSLEEDSEALLIIKTTGESVDSLTSVLMARHPYDVPEVIAIPISKGSSKYLDWVLSSTSPSPSPEDVSP